MSKLSEPDSLSKKEKNAVLNLFKFTNVGTDKKCGKCNEVVPESEALSHCIDAHKDDVDKLRPPKVTRPTDPPRAESQPHDPKLEIKELDWSASIEKSRTGRIARRCATCGEPAVANSDGCSEHDPK